MATKTAAKPKTKNHPIPADKKIRLLKTVNPFRKGSKRHTKFASIKTGMTVAEARKATTSGWVRFILKRELAVLE